MNQITIYCISEIRIQSLKFWKLFNYLWVSARNINRFGFDELIFDQLMEYPSQVHDGFLWGNYNWVKWTIYVCLMIYDPYLLFASVIHKTCTNNNKKYVELFFMIIWQYTINISLVLSLRLVQTPIYYQHFKIYYKIYIKCIIYKSILLLEIYVCWKLKFNQFSYIAQNNWFE